MQWGVSKIFKYRAKCPECGEKVPLGWWISSRPRPCPVCSRLIQPMRKWELLATGISGAVCGGSSPWVMSTFVGHDVSGITRAVLLGIGGGISAALMYIAIYPYLMHFKTVAQSPTCLNCGYDLRATPDRCPECGAIPGKGKSNF